MYITNHYLVAIHNVLCSVLVRFCVFTCCEPPRCLQVRCRLTCSNRSPNRFISSRFAVAGARSFVPTTYPPPKRRPKNIRTHFLPAPLLRKANMMTFTCAPRVGILGQWRLAAHQTYEMCYYYYYCGYM